MNDKILDLNIPEEVIEYLSKYKCPFCNCKLHIKDRAIYYDGVYETFARCTRHYKKDTFTEYELTVYWNFSKNNNIYVDSYSYGFIVNNNLYLMRHNCWPNMGYEFSSESFSIEIEVSSLDDAGDYIPDFTKMNFCTKPKYFDFNNISAESFAKTIHRVAILR